MLRPFPFVIMAAVGLLLLKSAVFMADNSTQIAGLDPMATGSVATGSISKRLGQKPILEPMPTVYNDEKAMILVRTLNALPARDAAKIFANFDEETQIEVSTKLSPLVFADILSQLTPEKAQNYTKALSADVQANKTAQK